MDYIETFSEYLLKEKKYSLHTITSYKKDVLTFISFIEEKKNILLVTSKEVRQWIVFLHNQELNHRSINRKISSLKAFYKFLYVTHQIESFPMEAIRNLKIEKKIQLPFSESEMKALDRNDFSKDFNGDRDYLIIVLFYNFGLRKTELIDLKISDYQSDYLRVLGKGKKERYIPIDDNVKNEIEFYLSQREKLVTSDNMDFFFVNLGKKLNQTFVYRLINNYFRGITSKEKRSPHILRHSFASHLVQNGAEINAVKKLMGHASLSSTQVYVQNNIEELKKVYKSAHPRFNKK